jgi:hypothetical protein
MYRNYLHLDFKGVVPAIEKLPDYLKYFKTCGFEGIIFEFDCRYQWQTWPDAAIPLLSKDDIKKLISHCHDLDLQTIPLIQIQGHLEWVLKHDRFAYLREKDFYNELCPSHPESKDLIYRWIDETLELFPETEYIHLGGDETLNYASCPKCMDYASRSKHGKFGVYIDHVSECCRYALSRGVRPMIWADMFWREESSEFAAELPEGTILADWQYTGQAPFQTTLELEKSGHEVWGASAISCGWYESRHSAQRQPGPRLENILSWNKWGEDNNISIIHTTWGRPGNLWNLYPPWIGQLPFFIAAGSTERWQQHPWHNFFENLNDIMFRDWPHELEQVLKDIETLPAADEWERECLQWWNLALRYQLLFKEYLFCNVDRRCMLETQKFVCCDPHVFKEHFEKTKTEIPKKLLVWEKDLQQFWNKNKLSDLQEFVAEKKAIFHFE